MEGYAQLDFESMPIGEATQIMNENTILVVMIETPEAVENVDPIAAVAGIDVVHVGTGDLLAEMGLHGQVDHPKVAEAFEQVIAACRKHGRFAGMGGIRDQALAEKYVRMGFRFLTTNSDLAFLLKAATERVKQMRDVKLD